MMWTVDIFVCTVCLFHVLFCRADQRSGGISFPLAKNELHFEMFCLNCIFSNSTAKGRKILYTRMHSSRMRTGRTLTVFRSLLFRGEGSGPGGVPAWSGGGLVPGGTYLVWGCLVRYSPPVNRMTHTCKNITLAKTSFRPVINVFKTKQ